LIREIHAELMRGVRGSSLQSGKLRASQVYVGLTRFSRSSAARCATSHTEMINTCSG